MRVSAVLSTLGKVDIRPLLRSLAAQTTPLFELIIVEQGEENDVAAACAEFSGRFRLIHLRSGERGLSRGRNAGLAQATGDVYFFPDDDARYDKHFLEEGLRPLQEGYGFAAGLCYIDESQAAGRLPTKAGPAREIVPTNLLSSFIEFTLVIRHDALGVLRFDEQVGVGSGTPAGADEGVDLLMRLLESGVRGRFVDGALAYHPDKVDVVDQVVLKRAFSYATGRGYMLRKYWFGWRVLAAELVRPPVGMLLFAIRGDIKRARYYLAVTRGKLRGLVLNFDE